jgi:hypothetical protein
MPRSSVVELRTMPPLNPENDVTVYIVVEDLVSSAARFERRTSQKPISVRSSAI